MSIVPFVGGTVARAKRTDRADARRRYRASLAEPLDGEVDEADEAAEAPAPVAGHRPGTTRAAATRAPAAGSGPSNAAPARPSITAAFRSSFRPLDLRGDIRALPGLLRTRAFLLPVILSGLSVALVPLLGLNALTSTFYQYFSFTAPLGTAFLAGFLAPRASWLLGLLTALASVGFQALAFNGGTFGGFLSIFTDPATGADLNVHQARDLVLSQALWIGVPSAAFFASAAAWYRRFLTRANPNRARAAAASSRRPDGRVAKRNQGRPLLARRR
jgi:hypothetical protein